MFKRKSNINLRGSRIISFIGARGGAGTTTISLNVAQSLANAGKSVLYVDGDLNNPSAYLYLGVKVDDMNIALMKGLRQESKLDSLLLPTKNKRIKLISESPLIGYGMLGDANLPAIHKMIDDAAEAFDAVIIDCPSNYEAVFTIAAIEKSNDIIMVTDGDSSSLVRMSKMKDFIRSFSGIDKLNACIVNKTICRTFSREVMDNVGFSLLFTIGHSQAIYEIGNKQEIVLKVKSMSEEVNEFKTAISTLIGYITR